MDKRLTLTQYINSKEQLIEAIKHDPVVEHVYIINKYCKMPVGPSDELKEYISMKPKSEIVITWRYTYNDQHECLHEMQRMPVKVVVVDKKTEHEYTLFQTDDRLSKWIQTNARIAVQ